MNGTLAAKNQYFHIQIETQKTTQRRFRFGTNDSNAHQGIKPSIQKIMKEVLSVYLPYKSKKENDLQLNKFVTLRMDSTMNFRNG